MNLPGAQLPEPLRRAYLEALTRRAEAHDGAVRAWVEQRLAAARTSLSLSIAPAPSSPHVVPTLTTPSTPTSTPTSTPNPTGAAIPSPGADRRPGPLAELTALLDRTAAPGLAPGAATHAQSTLPAGADTAGPPELKSLQRDRAAWARLSVDQELQRALAQVPDNPGPLNSRLLVLRSLRLMQTISPDYLARFVSQLETLVWLDQASFGALPVRAPAVRREPAAKRPRSRGGKAAVPGG